jgi:hypothetical protein
MKTLSDDLITIKIMIRRGLISAVGVALALGGYGVRARASAPGVTDGTDAAPFADTGVTDQDENLFLDATGNGRNATSDTDQGQHCWQDPVNMGHGSNACRPGGGIVYCH